MSDILEAKVCTWINQVQQFLSKNILKVIEKFWKSKKSSGISNNRLVESEKHFKFVLGHFLDR